MSVHFIVPFYKTWPLFSDPFSHINANVDTFTDLSIWLHSLSKKANHMSPLQNPTSSSLTISCFGPGDDVFRAMLMLMSELDEYKNAPLSKVNIIEYCIKGEKYLAAVRGDQLVGGVLWFEIDAFTRDQIIHKKIEPIIKVPLVNGDALLVAAAFAVDLVIVGKMLRAFFKHMSHRDIIYIRHWQNKQAIFKPVLRKAKERVILDQSAQLNVAI